MDLGRDRSIEGKINHITPRFSNGVLFMDKKLLQNVIVGLLIAALIGYTITDGIETGQRGGRIYEGYQNSELTIKYSQISTFRQSVQSPTEIFWWNWCVW